MIFNTIAFVFRLVRIWWRLKKSMDFFADSAVDDLLEKMLGDMIYISPENATARPSSGHFVLEKTHLLPEMFADLHVPFTVKGGFVELLYVDLSFKKKKTG